MRELWLSAKSSVGLKHDRVRMGLPVLPNPPRWEITMTDGSTPPVQRVPTHIFVRQPGPASGGIYDISSESPGHMELEDICKDDLLLAVNSLLDGGLPFMYIADEDKVPLVEQVTVDVRAVEHLNPSATLGLILICEVLHDRFGRKVRLLIPGDNGSGIGSPRSACMWSPSFLTVIQDIADVEGDPAVSSGSRTALVRKIASPSDISGILVALDDLIDSQNWGSGPVSLVSELCKNILEHSMPGGTPHGYMASHVYGDFLQLAVADLGVGIPANLRNRAECRKMSDIDILREACKSGVSSTGGYNRGLGLNIALNEVRKANGYLNICCGNASVLLGCDTDSGQRRREQYTDDGIHRFSDLLHDGTQIGALMFRIR